jgi:uncharacterized membrane protein YfcA
MAIGTSALAVAVNAFANLISHSRAGNVKWPCAAVFAVSGVVGAAIGALGKAMDGSSLLFLFGLVMIAVAAAMLSTRAAAGDPSVKINPAIAIRLVSIGAIVGLLSGFFIKGGIVGGLIGVRVSRYLAGRRAMLTQIFTLAVFVVAGFVLWPSAPGLSRSP